MNYTINTIFQATSVSTINLFSPNIMNKLLALLFHIWKVMGSNPGPEKAYPGLSVPPRERHHSALFRP